MEVRRLEVPGADRLTGSGVYYGAALTEAANYRGRHVFVVGGANSAGQGAMFFSRYAERVTVLCRRDLATSMSSYLVEQITSTPNIEVWKDATVKEVRGGDRLETLVVDRAGEAAEVPAAALFVFIGQAPRTELVAGIVARDAGGFILTGADVPAEHRVPGYAPSLLETSVPGIFAAGDARAGSQKRVAAAVGEGAVAIALIHAYMASV
jgi:thioredoxin reductase (NADPH)